MDEFITLTETNWAFWVAGLFALLEFLKWLFSFKDFFLKTIGIKTKGMLKREEFDNRLKNVETAIEEIKDTSKQNVEMFLNHEQLAVEQFGGIRDEIVSELNRLHEKMDENQRENDETDRAVIRDRLNGAMRYFSQNKDEHGNVHISLGDYEVLNDLFQKYFAKKGNGAFKKMYEDEFQKFIIDR